MRKFRIRTCSSNARAAPVLPPEGPEEAAEGSPFTETWEIRAIVAEAVTAALAQAMPRIIVAALTGTHRKLSAAGSSTPGAHRRAEGSPFTETWEIRAIVAEAVTAALAQAMPRIIVAALTGTHRKLSAAGSSTPGAHRRSSGSTFRIFTPANRGPSRVRNGTGCRPSPIP